MDNFRRLLEEESHQRNSITIDFFTSYPRFSPPRHVSTSPSHDLAQARPLSTVSASIAELPAQQKTNPRATVVDTGYAMSEAQPNEAGFVDSANYLEFEGQYWYLILKYRSNALRTAFLADTADALSLQPSCVRDLRFAQTQLVAHFTIRHSTALSAEQVKRLLDAHPYPRVWKIYRAVLSLFHDQFAEETPSVRASDLEALVQRVYSGEEDVERGDDDARVGKVSVGSPPSSVERGGVRRRSDSVVKRAALSVEPFTPAPRGSAARTSQVAWLQAVPLEDSVSFEGAYQIVVQLHRHALEAAVLQDIVRAVPSAQDAVVRGMTVDASRLLVHYAITSWTRDTDLVEVREALSAYPFPETWRLLLATPPVVKSAAESPHSAAAVTRDGPLQAAATAGAVVRHARHAAATIVPAVAPAPVFAPATPVSATQIGATSFVTTAHRLNLIGEDWGTVLEKEPLPLRNACAADAAAATSSLSGCVVAVAALALQDDGALSVELTARHPAQVSGAAVDAALASHTLSSVWGVYDAVHTPETPSPTLHKVPEGCAVTPQTAHFDGNAWAPILVERSEAVKGAFVSDVAEALGLPESCVTVDRAHFADFLVIQYTVQRPFHMTVHMVTRAVDAAPMTRVWGIYAQYLTSAGIAAKSTTSSLLADGSAARRESEVVSRRPSHAEEERRTASAAAVRGSVPGRATNESLTTHIVVLDGDRWDAVVNAYPESVKDAVRADFCRANEVDRSAVTQVTLHLIPNGLRAAIDFEHSPTVSAQLVTERLERCEMNAMWDLYADVLEKLATSPTTAPRASTTGSSSQQRNSVTRVVTNHALRFDEPLLTTRPASVTSALKKDLNPLLSPLGAHIVDVTMETSEDGVTILYTVSHDAGVSTQTVDNTADAADMQNVWDLADELASAAEAQEAAAKVPSPVEPVSPRRSSQPFLPQLHQWEEEAPVPVVPEPVDAQKETEHPRSSVCVISEPGRTPSSSPPTPTEPVRVFAEEEEEPSVAASLSQLSSRVLNSTRSEDNSKSTPLAGTPSSATHVAASRRVSHASLASHRTSVVSDLRSRVSSNHSLGQVSVFCVFFEGGSWARVLALHSEELLSCIAEDISEALSVPLSEVLNVVGEYADGLLAHYELLCPAEKTQVVNAAVDASPMARAWDLYQRVISQPSTWERRKSVETKSNASQDGRRLSHSALTSSVGDALSRRVSVEGLPTGELITRHAVYFDGTVWLPLLSEREPKLRLALIQDITEAVGQPASTLTELDVEYADGLLVEYEISHPASMTIAMINAAIDASPMQRTWDLLNAYLAEPPPVAASPLKPLVSTAEVLPRLVAYAEKPPTLLASERVCACPPLPCEPTLPDGGPAPRDAQEMPHPPRRFIESGRAERPLRARYSGEAGEVRQYHSDEHPTPNDLNPLETLEETSAPAEEDVEENAELQEVEEDEEVTEFAIEFDGSQWELLLDSHASRLTDAFVADVSEALTMPASVIRGVNLFAVDGLTINYTLKLPEDVDTTDVNARADAFDFPRTWDLYDHFIGQGASSAASFASLPQPSAHVTWIDFVRKFREPLWSHVVPQHTDRVRELFAADTAELIGVPVDSIRIVHVTLEPEGLYVHFCCVLPAGLEEVVASNMIGSCTYPGLLEFYAQCGRQDSQTPPQETESVAQSADDNAGSEWLIEVDSGACERSPVAPYEATVEPAPALEVEAVAARDAPQATRADPTDAHEPSEEGTDTSVHTVYVEGFWNAIAVRSAGALKEAFTKDVMHALGIPARLVTQVEPLAFRHGLLVTYVISHDTGKDTQEIGDVDDLMDEDPLDNMWELYARHEDETPESGAQRGSVESGLVELHPRARHNSLSENLAVNPAITDDIADRYYSMLFEGASWPQVLSRERATVRQRFTEDCINALSAEEAFSPHTVTSVQVIMEIPLHEGMLVHYLVDHANPEQREVVDDLVARYAFPLTWAVFDEYMRQTSTSPRNSMWVAARRSRSRATSYASSPDTARVYNIVAYAEDPPAPIANGNRDHRSGSGSSIASPLRNDPLTSGDASVHTVPPPRTSVSSMTDRPQSSHEPPSRPATSHRSLTSFRVERGGRPTSLRSESFDSVDGGSHSEEAPKAPTANAASPPAPDTKSDSPGGTVGAKTPSKATDPEGVDPSPQRVTQDFTFPDGPPLGSPFPPQSLANSADSASVDFALLLPPLRATDEQLPTLRGEDHAPPTTPPRLSPPPLRASKIAAVYRDSGVEPEASRMPPSPPSSCASEPKDESGSAARDTETAPVWLYAFDFEPERAPTPASTGIVHQPIAWVASPKGMDDGALASSAITGDDWIVELPVSPNQRQARDSAEDPVPPTYNTFFQPPISPAKQRRIVVLDHTAAPRPEEPSLDVLQHPAALPMTHNDNVIVIIRRTTLDVDGLLDKLGQLEDLVRNRCDNMRELFDAI